MILFHHIIYMYIYVSLFFCFSCPQKRILKDGLTKIHLSSNVSLTDACIQNPHQEAQLCLNILSQPNEAPDC